MDIETKGLGAGSYPEPKEENVQWVNGKIILTYEFDEAFFSNWGKDRIIDDIKSNLDEYISFREYDNVEIEIE